ncbi:threonine/serine dehydratase [Geminicoccaceae bacterium 1502E]|nr:threonine/serine dehydratase [Geminicoccaceae bacterium 1502E]
MTSQIAVPTLEEIRAARQALRGRVALTPVLDWDGPEFRALLPEGTRVNLKLELFQHTGSFKARGALTVMTGLSREALERGVTAVSAGNHAIATAWAARELGSHARVVMFKSANPARIAKVRRYGGEVVIADDVAGAFAEAERIEREEGRTFVHPYEGPRTALGTATIGQEWLEQAGGLDAVIVPVGGGGLLAGISAAVGQASPSTRVFGVEPFGADSMWRSFEAGEPRAIDKPRTIADSLGAPFALPYSFGLCRRFTEEIVRIEDAAMQRAMALLLDGLKLACEPAGAAATAALLGPLRERLAGKRVGIIVCGSNIDLDSYTKLLAAAPDA